MRPGAECVETAVLYRKHIDYHLPNERSKVTTLDFTDSLNRAMYMPVNCAVSHDETEKALKLSTNSGSDVM